MKRTDLRPILSLLLAVILLWAPVSCLAGEAEEPAERDTSSEAVKIQESMVTDETGEKKTALQENLSLIISLLNSEEFRELIKLEDARLLLRDVGVETGLWLWENRPVTMQILAELGLGENELGLVGRIWDSAEIIVLCVQNYLENTEDGQRLKKEYEAVSQEGVFRQSVLDFFNLATSQDLQALLQLITEGLPAEDDWEPDPRLKEYAEAKGLNLEDPETRFALRIISVILESSWAQKSLPELMNDLDFWLLYTHLLQLYKQPELQPAITELEKLVTDPEMSVYLAGSIESLIRALAAEEKAVELAAVETTPPENLPEAVPAEAPPAAETPGPVEPQKEE